MNSIINRLKKILEKHRETIKRIMKYWIPFLAVLFPAIGYVFKFIYTIQCQDFYGIYLDCFDSSIYIKRWVLILYCIILSMAYIVFMFISEKSKKDYVKMSLFINVLIEAICIFCIDLMIVPIIFYNTDCEFLLELISDHMILIILSIAVFSFLFSLALAKLVRKKRKIKTILLIILILCIIMQFLYFSYFIISYGVPDPENINSYTVVTTSEDSEKYIVVGEYKDSFVCMEIEKAFNENGEEIVVQNNTNDETNFNYSQISVKKSEYQLFSESDIEKFNTYKYITLNTV